MSGHLQRMAAGVARPERGVRPLVGNLFAKEQESFEETTLIGAPQSVAAASVAPKGLIERERVGRAPVSEDKAPRLKTQPDRLVGREPVAAKESLAPDSKRPALLEETTRETGQENTPDRTEKLVETREVMRPVETHTLLVQQMLVPERVERGAEETPEREAAESLVIQPLGERAAVERVPARREKREGRVASEEIQIHIGRIEVIAVPAPQQRAAAPVSARKTESLEEYLRRRDRRSR